MNRKSCHICLAQNTYSYSGFSQLHQVTSDCRAWHPGGELILCKTCQTLQKSVDAHYLFDIKKIYHSYNIYSLSKGHEQRGFDQATGISLARSELIVKWLTEQKILLNEGKMLDIGCGRGNLLDSFATAYPQWSVSGFEIDDKHRINIEQKHHHGSFYSGDLDTITKQFNLICLIHTLEHIHSPNEVLNKIYHKLAANGYLLIAVPNSMENPFDLLIADHCTHFSQNSLLKLLHNHGFSVVAQLKNGLQKEIIVVAKKHHKDKIAITKYDEKPLIDSIQQQINWLIDISEQMHTLGSKKQFAVFGTTIAANWLLAFKSEQIAFFLDEDPDKKGTYLEDKAVYHPGSNEFDHNTPVFLPFPLSIARKLALRLEQYDINCVLPPNTLE